MIGTPELIAILVAVLFLFGPQKLPELARSLGGAMGEFKKKPSALLSLSSINSMPTPERLQIQSLLRKKRKRRNKKKLQAVVKKQKPIQS
ncbi:twin-arginine translocase TatA/TatE family subunit [Methanosarcina barkeri]|uniref:twin-arginine translocase TatA/TatE family subunit n=1 Tax=Methanosarcina barkeri TaxID=2208 RepID=UPI000A3EDB69|nr:twin-arginine translocase TatA/TatE family subunit [Methanosarcina barkeri]